MEATETTIQERAAVAASWFESAQRVHDDEETEYVRLKDGRPEWVQDLVREAHGDMFPDDFRYAVIKYALDYIAENGDGEECYAEEFADQNVDVYTGRLLAWLGSNLRRVGGRPKTPQPMPSKPANLRNLKRAAADLAAARAAFEEALEAAHAAGASSRALGKAAGMSHQGVRRIIAARAPAPRNSDPAPKPDAETIPRLREMSDAEVAALSHVDLQARLDAALARMRTFQSGRSRGYQRAHAIWKQALAETVSDTSPKPGDAGEQDANEAALEARLAELDGRWDKLVDRLAPKFEPTDPRREQLHRNQVNGRIRKAESGRNRDGSARGTVGKGRGARIMPTVKAEMRACAEAEILRAILNHPEDSFFVRLKAELDEAREIRVRLEQLAEARCGF